MMDTRRLWISGLVLAFSAAAASAEIKVLLCPGDYGMWAQDRATLIIEAVDTAAPGQVIFEVEQSYNFVQKLQTPGFAGRYDVIVVGDVGLGQIPTKTQQELVRAQGWQGKGAGAVGRVRCHVQVHPLRDGG